MNKIKLELTVLFSGLLLFSSASTLLIQGAKALPQVSPINKPFSPLGNSTSDVLPSIQGESVVGRYSTNAIYSPPSANVELTQPPGMRPIIRPGSSVVQYSLLEDQNSWWSIDFWSTTSGDQMPQYMAGQLVAVKNTIDGMSMGDWVSCEPINVAYGTSNNNFVWYQFCIDFFAYTDNPSWCLWDFPNGDRYSGRYFPITLPYIIGDTYNFGYTASGTNTVTFTIFDTADPENPYTKTYSAPGLTLIFDQGAYSPASCVEGVTTGDTLTNIPYFQSYLGYGATDHYHSDSPGVPSGIGTGIWRIGSSPYYYWSMIGQNYVSNVITSNNMQYGSVSDADYISGDQDGQYAYIYGGNFGDGGNINAEMNALSGGYISVYGYSDSGYYSDLLVYVSNDDSTWTLVNSAIVSSTTPSWINVGVYMGDFQYIAIAGFDSGYSVSLHLDAVRVTMPDMYDTTINVYYTWGGSPYYINYEYSYDIWLPYGTNYLNFEYGPYGGYFMVAYDWADFSSHDVAADTYWTDYGTSIDVLWSF
jgi:hypothetical protein